MSNIEAILQEMHNCKISFDNHSITSYTFEYACQMADRFKLPKTQPVLEILMEEKLLDAYITVRDFYIRYDRPARIEEYPHSAITKQIAKDSKTFTSSSAYRRLKLGGFIP